MESILNQSVRVDALYIGMSFANREVLDEFEPRLRDIVRECKDIHIKFIPEKTAQGIMWHTLIKEIPDLSDTRTWILFGDDDDLWHPSRVKLYRDSIENGLRCNVNISDVRSTCYAIASDGDQPSSSNDVDVLWEQERLTLEKTVGGHYLDGNYQQSGNYVDHCVRAGIFAEFMQISNLFMRSNLQFDMMLQCYICVISRLPKWKEAKDILEQHIDADDSDRHRKITRLLRYSRETARRYPHAIQEMMCIPDMTLPEMFKMAMDADDEWVSDHRIEMHSLDQYQNCTPVDAIKLRMHQLCKGNSELENALKQIPLLRIQGAVVAPRTEQFKNFPRLYNFARTFQL